jgi:hypothetical protein
MEKELERAKILAEEKAAADAAAKGGCCPCCL